MRVSLEVWTHGGPVGGDGTTDGNATITIEGRFDELGAARIAAIGEEARDFALRCRTLVAGGYGGEPLVKGDAIDAQGTEEAPPTSPGPHNPDDWERVAGEMLTLEGTEGTRVSIINRDGPTTVINIP